MDKPVIGWGNAALVLLMLGWLYAVNGIVNRLDQQIIELDRDAQALFGSLSEQDNHLRDTQIKLGVIDKMMMIEGVPQYSAKAAPQPSLFDPLFNIDPVSPSTQPSTVPEPQIDEPPQQQQIDVDQYRRIQRGKFKK